MIAPTDIYTPWREDSASVAGRHVGRGELLAVIHGAITAFLESRAPTHLYLFAPRGLGKSHLIKLAWDRAQGALHEARVPSVLIPEDIPELGSADAILKRVASTQAGARWLNWRHGSSTLASGPMVVFFEGLDRQLQAMQEEERRKLRALLDERGPFLVIATGVALGDALTSRDTAFYAAFSAWPVGPLSDDDASSLLDRLAEHAADTEAWPPRRQALVRLAGGSPRTLVALGRACAARPDAWASEYLYTVVQQFTAHYQMRFRDLAAQQQQVVEHLALAPRELTPTDLGEMMQIGTSHASGIARRLLDHGVIQARVEGRSTWYRLTEPLFRFWMEYRNAPWEQTRIGLLGRLLEAVLTPPDLASMWMHNPDEGLVAAVEEILVRSRAQKRQIWEQLVADFSAAVATSDVERAEAIIRRGLRSPPPLALTVKMAAIPQPSQGPLRQALVPLLKKQHMEVIQVAWDFEVALLQGDSVREAFHVFIQRASGRVASGPAGSPPPRVVWDYVRSLVAQALQAGESRGTSWILEWDERSQIARIPVLRAHFLVQGKRVTHRPILAPDDLLTAGILAPHTDWDLLLNAAMRRAHGGLFGVLLHLAGNNSSLPVPICGQPAANAPVPGDAVGRWLVAALADFPTHWPHALTWAASWADMPEERWTELLDALTSAQKYFPAIAPSWAPNSWDLSVALMALGRNALPRLMTLAERLGGPGMLADTFGRTVAMSSQLAERTTAHLHPELAELDRALETLHRR